jgi:SAM-dependent methyltransferase
VEQTTRRQAEVQDHYRKLAPSYRAKANHTCEQTYLRLLRRFLRQQRRVLEVGSGNTNLLERLGSPFAVACDLSADMLRTRAHTPTTHCVVAAGERLPFPDGCFDGLFLVNVLEHVAKLEAVVRESARVLEEGGIWLTVTPNGNWEYWLDLAERWSLKLPEGPHTFLTPRQLLLAVENWFEVAEQRTFLVLPVGPPALAGLLDRVTLCSRLEWGFFQYVAARRRGTAAPAQSR